MRIYVVVSQRQSSAHDALGGIGKLDVVEQELIDWTRWFPAIPVLLHVREDLRVIGCVRAHDCYWWRTFNCFKVCEVVKVMFERLQGFSIEESPTRARRVGETVIPMQPLRSATA